MSYRQIHLPHPTDEVINATLNAVKVSTDLYTWIPAPDSVQDWAKKNISPDMYWGIQIINGNMPRHKDIDTQVKFNYILRTGGDNVITGFFSDSEELIDTINFLPYTWYLMDVSVAHSVVGVESTRISLTGRVFPRQK